MLLVLLDEPTIDIYLNLAEARRELEAIDVANGEYQFCDDRGQRFRGIATRWADAYPVGFDLLPVGEPDPGNLLDLIDRAVGINRNPFFVDLAALRRSVLGRNDEGGAV